jgi:hypothetical protein
MAILTAPDCSAGAQPGGLRVGQVGKSSVYSINASLSLGDVIQMIKVPANSQVTYLMVNWKGAGVGSITVGDGVSTARYITATAASSGIGNLTINNVGFTPYTYSTDDTLDITVSQSVTFSAGSVVMVAHITMDP